jgi:hypothetical protein
MDMHSGGGQKLQWNYIYIEAPLQEAKVIFFHRFDRSPSRVTCTCCGPDFSMMESETLEEATGYERKLPWIEPVINGKPDARQGKQLEYGEEMPEGWLLEKYPPSEPAITIEEYCKFANVKIIRAYEILPEERIGDVPREGYVWMD